MAKTHMEPGTRGIFPVPVYTARRDSNLDSAEKKDIKDIIEEGNYPNVSNSTSNNSYIFDDKLKKLKEFCEQHIKIYAKEVINPKQELDFYITQSWLNVNKPGESHHLHNHPNSIISGVFYISTEEDDKIHFYDPAETLKDRIEIQPKEYNIWNSANWSIPAETNDLLLFPAWLEHSVKPNEKATKDRLSISFNVFAKGVFGQKEEGTELILEGTELRLK